jgi:hypothetical protein
MAVLGADDGVVGAVRGQRPADAAGGARSARQQRATAEQR